MYKNQLQELAQRSCFNLPWYSCIREGPDHAPRFKATVNFNGEVFESPNFCTTLRQAEHSAAEVALNSLSNKGPSHSLAARILDETGVYKNLLQEVSQRVGAALPQYTTVRSGLGHLPVFTCTVDLAGINFTGEPAKNKKQAEKNAAMAAWSSLKQLVKQDTCSTSEPENTDEQEQVTIARALLNYRLKEKMALANSPNSLSPFPKKFPMPHQRPLGAHPPPITASKILPLIRPKSVQHNKPVVTVQDSPQASMFPPPPENCGIRPQKFPGVDATPYIPIRHFSSPYHGMAQPVTIRNAVPVFSAPPLQPRASRSVQLMASSSAHIAPPVNIKQAPPVFSATPVRVEAPMVTNAPAAAKLSVRIEDGNMPQFAVPQVHLDKPPFIQEPPPPISPTRAEVTSEKTSKDLHKLVATAQVVSSPPKFSAQTFAPAAKASLHVEDAGNETGNDREASAEVQGLKQLQI